MGAIKACFGMYFNKKISYDHDEANITINDFNITAKSSNGQHNRFFEDESKRA